MTRFVRFCAAALLLFGCSSKPPDEKLLDSVKPAVSWCASLQMTAEKWSSNSVPARFVASAAETADEEIDKALRAVDKSKADANLRDQLRRDLREARRAAALLANAARHENRAAAATLAPRFAALHKEMESLEK